MQKEFVSILKQIGEDPNREGLLKTPQRFEKSMEFLTQGYGADIDKVINNAIYHEKENGMIVVKNIEMYSLCEHHMLPFFGKCHVGYIPNGKVIGLSKIPRIVDVFSRRLQIQERLTSQIANTLQEKLKPLGLGVIIEAKHLCAMMRSPETKQRNGHKQHAGSF